MAPRDPHAQNPPPQDHDHVHHEDSDDPLDEDIPVLHSESDTDSDEEKYLPKYRFPIYTQKVVDGIAAMHPKASWPCWIFVQLIGVVVIFGCFAILFAAAPPVMVAIEWRNEQLKAEKMAASIFNMTNKKTNFETKLQYVFNQTVPTSSDLTSMIEEYVQRAYIDPYVKNNEDLAYINDDTKEDHSKWNYNNALQMLVSSITMTGTTEMKCENFSCNGILAFAATFGISCLTMLLSSSTFIIIQILRTIWLKLIRVKNLPNGPLFTKRECYGIILRDIFVMCTCFMIFIAAFIGAMFLASVGSVYKSWYTSRFAMLDQREYEHLLKKDAKLRNEREKVPQYVGL